MFLTESNTIKNEFLNEATYEASYMYEAILEANDAYHDLCMKMVKCEHSAIISENAEMISEANEDFKTKSANIIKTLVEKFKAFCSKVYDTFLSLMAKAAKMVAIAKPENLAGKTIKIEENYMDDYLTFAKGADKYLAAVAEGNFENNNKVLMTEKEKPVEAYRLSARDFNSAKAYIDAFKPAVQIVKKFRTDNFSKLTKDERVASTGFQLCTKLINKLRRGLVLAVKIIYAGTTKVKDPKEAKAKKADKAVKDATASASILDQF